MATTHDFPPDYVQDYASEEVVIHWQPHKCTHSANCVRGLPTVFQPQTKPWIKPHGASTDEIIVAVKRCPSGALTFTDKR